MADKNQFATALLCWHSKGAWRAGTNWVWSVQGFLDGALVVGSFHVVDRLDDEGLERTVR